MEGEGRGNGDEEREGGRGRKGDSGRLKARRLLVELSFAGLACLQAYQCSVSTIKC